MEGEPLMFYGEEDKFQRDQQYISSVRPIFSKKALYSDMTEDYLSPSEPNPYTNVRIRFRSAKNNIDRVFCVCKGEKNLMLKSETIEEFDYYDYEIQLDADLLTYYFEIVVGKIICYYDLRGVAKKKDDYYSFKLIPGFKTPEWAKGAVIYQIYIDRFFNGDTSNDVLSHEYSYINEHVTHVEDWNKYPATMGVREFYGGDLQGVWDKLDYLQELGIEAIYFNPLFVSPSNHKYDIQDYDHIDPHIGKIVNETGDLLAEDVKENRFASKYINRVANKENLDATDKFFAKFIEEVHKRGMKVIVDGVFNHCGSFNKWMDRERIYENLADYEKGAFITPESPYNNFFTFLDNHKWPYNYTYDGWWGHDTLPKLNYENSRHLYDYILYIARKWVSAPFYVDGWRLDVAADLGHSPQVNHKFWQDFRHAVKQANPEAIIIAEHYGDPSEWLKGNEWDTVMNYDAFMEPITWFLTGMQKHSDDYREDLYGNADSFWGAMSYQGAKYPRTSLYVSMNELSNHDHSRFLTRTNKKVGRVTTHSPEEANQGINKAVMREAVTIQMTWIGAPTIYYGDEAGVCGFTDPDNRRTYPWGFEDKELIAFHKEMIRIHKENSELKTGSMKHLLGEYNIIGYGRFNKYAQIVVLVNNNDSEVNKSISVWELGIPKEAVLTQLIMTSADGYSIESKQYKLTGGHLTITLPPTSAVVLQHRNPKAEEDKKAEKEAEKESRFPCKFWTYMI